jgi:hypothetical protein
MTNEAARTEFLEDYKTSFATEGFDMFYKKTLMEDAKKPAR